MVVSLGRESVCMLFSAMPVTQPNCVHVVFSNASDTTNFPVHCQFYAIQLVGVLELIILLVSVAGLSVALITCLVSVKAFVETRWSMSALLSVAVFSSLAETCVRGCQSLEFEPNRLLYR